MNGSRQTSDLLPQVVFRLDNSPNALSRRGRFFTPTSETIESTREKGFRSFPTAAPEMSGTACVLAEFLLLVANSQVIKNVRSAAYTVESINCGSENKEF